MEVLVVLPTYNEAENLPLMTEALMELGLDLGILVVDDNSPDGTGAVADRLAAEKNNFHVLHRSEKSGLGNAYKAAFIWALENTDARLIQQMDCDFSHDPNTVPALVEIARKGAVAVGSRYVAGGSAPDFTLSRSMISKFGCFYTRTILGLKINDVTGGFKCWPRETLESIDLLDVKSKQFFFQCEMSYLAQKNGFKLIEYPITFQERLHGKSKMTWQVAAEAFWLAWHQKFRAK